MTEPTAERVRKEWKAIYRGWERRGKPKDEVSPAMRLATKYKISCQRVFELVGRYKHDPRWPRPNQYEGDYALNPKGGN